MDETGQYVNSLVVGNDNSDMDIPIVNVGMNAGMNWNKIIPWIGIFLGGMALILSVVALILYSVIPQPVSRQYTRGNITSNDNKPKFTPVNMEIFSTTPTIGSSNPGVTANSRDKGSSGMFYIIHNKSNDKSVEVYNADVSGPVVTIAPNVAQLFFIDDNGKSRLVV
jgi:hypothetical protein